MKICVAVSFVIVLFSFCSLVSSASAVSIDLLAPFDEEGDGIIHFGDQYKSDFYDSDVDFSGLSTVTRQFEITTAPIAGGSFYITINHYEVSKNIGYWDYFSINGHDFDYLHDSSSFHWYTDLFTGSNDWLTLGLNTITFHVDGSTSNLDDFEISDFILEYDPAPAPVPEPGTVMLLGAGLLGLAGLGRKRLA